MDEEVAAAWSAASTWLAGVDHAAGEGQGLTSLLLPHPASGRAPLTTGLIDADSIHAVVAAAQKAGQEVDGLYVGLVAQEPSARWLGLAGIFLPVCPRCDGRGVGRATDRVLDLLGGNGFEEIPGILIPAGLRPGSGWFDRERLQTVARRTGGSRRTPWSPWPPAVSGDRPTGVLVRVGPVVTSLSGLVLCVSVHEALDLPELLGKSSAGWTWSAGELSTLISATRHRPRRPREVLSARRAIHDWWTPDGLAFDGASRRLHRGSIPSSFLPDGVEGVRFWALTGGGATTIDELRTLLHTPASVT